MKQRLNLYVDEKLIERVKIHAVLQKTSVSEIVEGLLLDYLDRQRKAKQKPASKS